MPHYQDPTHPTGVVSPRKNASTGNPGAAVARQRKADAGIQMRLAGATWAEIASTLGYSSPRTALAAVERALAKQLDNDEDKERMRRLAGQRLDRLLRAIWPKAIDPDHPEHLLAVTKAREVIDRHAKLYGLDAPTEVVVHSPTQQELEAWVTTVVAMSAPPVEEFDIFDADVVEDDDPPALAAGG